MFYTYILQSLADGSFYIGFTEDLETRLHKHNTANSGYTSRKQPWKIVYSEAFDTKTEARQQEIFLKKQKNRAFYQTLINGSSVGSLPVGRQGIFATSS